MHKMLSSIINKFDAEAKTHLERQSLNPFSGGFSRSPSPRLSKDQYGKPLAGSKTEERGHKAKCHILREILDLCTCIHDLGVYNKQHKPREDSDDEETTNDDEIIITFGEIFQMYTKINDKVVGLLIAAKKRGFLYFEKEILFQRRDDDVLIALIKPISEIRATINKELVLPSPVSISSRNASPTVSSDSEAEKTNGNVESNKSSSGSPVQQAKTGGTESPREIGSNVPSDNKEVDKPIAVNAQEGKPVENNVSPAPTEVEKPENNNNVEEKPCTSETNAVNVSSSPSVSEVNTETTTQTSDEVVKTEKEEITGPAEQISQQNEEHSVPKVEIISETSSLDNNNEEPPLPTEPVKILSELIPTIEISEAPTPVQERSREPSLVKSVEDNVEKTADDEINNGETVATLESDVADVNISAEGKENIDASLEPNENITEIPLIVPEAPPTPEDVALSTEGIKNIDLSPESYVSVTEMSQTSPDTFHIAEDTVEADMNEPNKPEDSIAQTFDKPCDVLLPCTSENDNERKRTFSNEELIESLTAALSAISSSPDPCDEEVEQIFRSQTAVSSLLNETSTSELNTIQEEFTEAQVATVPSTSESASENVDCAQKADADQSFPENNEPILKTDTEIIELVTENVNVQETNTPIENTEPTTETVNTLKAVTQTNGPITETDLKPSE